MTGSEFQAAGAVKLNERSPEPFKCLLAFFSAAFRFDERRRDGDGWYAQRDEDRYRGSDPSKCRYARFPILYSDRNFIGSQRSSLRMLSRALVSSFS